MNPPPNLFLPGIERSVLPCGVNCQKPIVLVDVAPADDAKALENDDIEKEVAGVTARSRSRSKRRRHHFLLVLRYYNHCNRSRLAYGCDADGRS